MSKKILFSRLQADAVPVSRVRATRYDSALTSAENAKHWALVDNKSADESLSPSVRRTLRMRSRYEVENNSYAKGMVLTVVGDCVGTGPRVQLSSAIEDTVLAHDLEQAFIQWANEIGLVTLLRSLRYAKAVDGEAFGLIATNPKLAGPAKVTVTGIDADRVRTFDPVNDADGLTFDRYGNVISYRVYTDQNISSDYTDVPAGNVIHWFRQDRPEQHRGAPELTPALPLFAQLRRYTLAVLGAAETAADFAAVLYTDSPIGGEAVGAEPFDVISLEKRMATTLPDGWKLGQLKAEQPVTNYPDFKREILGEIGRVLQIPVNIITGDSSKHNYASGRLDHQTYHRAIRIEQKSCEYAVLRPVFAAWFKEYSLAEKLQIAMPSPDWYWDGFEHVDPSKEASAIKTRLASLTTSLASEYAKQGKDWEEELRQIARERSLMKELNIDFNDGFNETVSKAETVSYSESVSVDEPTKSVDDEEIDEGR